MGGDQLSLYELQIKEPSIPEGLDLYKSLYLRSGKLEEGTANEYKLDIGQLVEYLENKNIRKYSRVTTVHLKEFLGTLEKRGVGAAARRRKISTIKSFFRFLYSRKWVPRNPARFVIPPQRPEKVRHGITDILLLKLVAASVRHPRDGAIIQLLIQTGITQSELLKLTIDSVQLKRNRGSVKVWRGGKAIYLPLDDSGYRALHRWLGVRPTTRYQVLFLSGQGKSMGRRTLQDMVAKYANEVGDKRITCRAIQQYNRSKRLII